jgi:menaquinol-cytochrome c reductase iron-sulfur subunit
MADQQPAGEADPDNSPRATPPRRRFLAAAGKVVAGLACVGISLAALKSVYPPMRRWLRWPRSKAPQSVAIDSLPPGEWKLVTIESAGEETPNGNKKSVWIYRDRNLPESFRVLSAVCTHNGCIVNWRADRKLFVCPCHGGTFDADGNRQGGPPRRALARVDYRIKDGQLLVRAEDV